MTAAPGAGVTDRRRASRAALGLAARLERLGPTPITGMAMTCDLSEGGVRLVAPDTFQIGDVVFVMITSGELTVSHQGLVVARQEDADSTAMLSVAFKTLRESDRAILRRIMDGA